jgi:nucleotidyltransferase-like protein
MTDPFAGCLAELERRGLLPEPALAAFVVGSVAKGWANTTSDYDICVVTTRPWAGESGKQLRVLLDPPTVPSAMTEVDSRRWEVKYWLDSQVDQMLAKVSWPAFEEGRVAGQILVDTEELFLERLVSCVPLAGEDWVRRRRGEVEASAFRAYVVTRSLAESDGSVEDALGQLAADDLESAVLSARRAFGLAVDALLESAGEYGYHTPKWRARRFRAASPAAMSFDDYWAIETMRDLDPQAPAKWVEKVIRICKDIAIEAEI